MKSFLNRPVSERGFTLLEMMVVVSIMAIVGSMATASLVSTRKGLQGDGAMRLVMTQFNIARETAITQRRNIELQFVGGNWIRTIRHEAPGITTTLLTSVALESNATFSQVTGAGVGDTLDGFGTGTGQGVVFGLATSIQFTTDGTLIDGNGNPLNGTIFLSIANQPESARAVTVLGSTGRVRGYKWTPASGTFPGAWVRV